MGQCSFLIYPKQTKNTVQLFKQEIITSRLNFTDAKYLLVLIFSQGTGERATGADQSCLGRGVTISKIIIITCKNKSISVLKILNKTTTE